MTCILNGGTRQKPISQLAEYFKGKSKSNCLYYTYVLVDPRIHVDDIELDFEAFVRGVFYIGKGKDGRCADHFFKTGLQGKCQVCKQAYCLEDMMIPAHRSPDPRVLCCSSPKAPKKIKCDGCLGFIEVAEGKFIHHLSSEDCDANKQEYSKRCHVCDREVTVHETKDNNHSKGAIKPHNRQCAGTRKKPSLKKGKCRCSHCREKVEFENGRLKPHKKPCPGKEHTLEKGKSLCLECREKVELENDAIKPHKRPCPRGGQKLGKLTGKLLCLDCREKVELEKGCFKTHKSPCSGGGYMLEKGKCLKCEQSVEIYRRETSPFVKGDMKRHRRVCSKSEELPTKIVLDIKDRKVCSIWKAGKTPTAVICNQGDTEEHAKQKEAMMMMAYGKDNISTQESGGYKRGKLVNMKMESVSGLGFKVESSEFHKYGVNLLTKAFKTYTRKQPCAQIMWPSNPKEVQPSDDDDSDDDSGDGTAEEQEEEEIEV